MPAIPTCSPVAADTKRRRFQGGRQAAALLHTDHIGGMKSGLMMHVHLSQSREAVMTTIVTGSQSASSDTRVGQVDLKLEVITLPVSNLDRSKEFYGGLGWRLDADFKHGADRAIQFTPPGSPCSIHFTANGTPGSAKGLFLVVSDIQAARDELVRRGVAVSEIFHFAAGPGPFGGQVSGAAPDRMSYDSYATFSDPDGNGWLLQEVTTRFPGRVAGDTTYASVADLAQALRRASSAHGEHEKRTGQPDANWPDWYAEYMVAEQAGKELPS
jgi:catechol 2,3-dioxygenase-like lactoylglutathione lyase family enzyme